MKMTFWSATGIAFTILIAATASSAADVYAYQANGDGGFGVVDLTTGVFTLRGNSGLQLAGLGEAGGVLYATSTAAGPLYSVDTATGALTAVGGSTHFQDFGSTTTGLYGVQGNGANLYSVTTTGATTLLGPTGINVGGNPWGLSTGLSGLYMDVGPRLYAINATTGAGTLVGTSTSGNFGLSVFTGGVLYGASEFPNQVYTLNEATGQGTAGPLETGASSEIYGWAPILAQGVPEPATWIMILVGFGGLGAAMRTRRKSMASAACD
jgi:hypothetical protein